MQMHVFKSDERIFIYVYTHVYLFMCIHIGLYTNLCDIKYVLGFLIV